MGFQDQEVETPVPHNAIQKNWKTCLAMCDGLKPEPICVTHPCILFSLRVPLRGTLFASEMWPQNARKNKSTFFVQGGGRGEGAVVRRNKSTQAQQKHKRHTRLRDIWEEEGRRSSGRHTKI